MCGERDNPLFTACRHLYLSPPNQPRSHHCVRWTYLILHGLRYHSYRFPSSMGSANSQNCFYRKHRQTSSLFPKQHNYSPCVGHCQHWRWFLNAQEDGACIHKARHATSPKELEYSPTRVPLEVLEFIHQESISFTSKSLCL